MDSTVHRQQRCFTIYLQFQRGSAIFHGAGNVQVGAEDGQNDSLKVMVGDAGWDVLCQFEIHWCWEKRAILVFLWVFLLGKPQYDNIKHFDGKSLRYTFQLFLITGTASF